jgi:endoglucanase
VDEKLIEILQNLSNVPATSGDETPMRRALRPLLKEQVDELRVDGMGNLITLKRGSGESEWRVLVTAHMDEVGFMVIDHTESGTLRVSSIGGIDPRLLPGLEVSVGEKGIPGVFGIQPIHRADSDKVTPLEKLTIDIGAGGKDEAKQKAPVGTRVTFATQARNLGRLVAGKAFDDRAGCAALVALLQGEPFGFDLYGVFTVQEEVGLRGARVAAYAVEPHAAISLEGTIADDLPKEEDVSPTSELGKGPVITVMDRTFVAHPRLLQLFVQTAEAEEIPYQFKQPGIGGTDSGSIHLARGGVPSITVAVPCRYIHGPIALLHPRDLEQMVSLVRAALERLSPETLETAAS